MQKFGNTLITNQGRAMLTAVDGAQGKLTYTKAILSTQDLKSMSADDIRALDQLSDNRLETTINVVNLQDNTVTIGVSFNNAKVSQDLKFNSIGWFAKTSVDSQEKLLAITPSETEQTLVAGSNGQSTASTDIELVMARSHNTTVTINPTAVGLINNEQLESAVSAAKSQLSSDVSSKIADVNKKIDSKVSTSDYTIKTTAIDQKLDSQGNRLDNVEKVKADKSSVYTQDQINSQMATKANASDVYTKSQIDSDLSARDTQITNAASLANKAQATANTKANASDVTEISGRLGKLEGTQTLDSPDFNSITASGVYYITNNNVTNIKNNPVGTWGVLVVSNGDGHRASQVYYPDDGNSPWCRSLNESNWLPWYQLSTKKDVSNATDLANQAQTTANTKANASDVYTKNQIDSKTSGTIVTAYDIASKTPTKETNRYINRWLVDQGVLTPFADQINQLKGRRQVDTPDFNTLTDSGVYFISNTNRGKNLPPTSNWGTLAVFNGNNQRIMQIFSAADGTGVFTRIYGINGAAVWGSWNQMAWTSDITNLQNQINANDNGTFTTGYDWNTATPTNQSRTLQNAWIVDQEALKGAVDRMNSINSNANGRLSLDGGNMNLRSMINWTGGDIYAKTGNLGGLHWAGGTDTASIYGDQDDNDNLDLAFDLGDDTSNHFSYRVNGKEVSAIQSNGHYTGTVDWNNVSGHPDVDAIVTGASGDDLFAFKTNQIRLYSGIGNTCKNLPPASNKNWFTVQYVFESPTNDGIAIYRSPANEIWTAGCNGKAYNVGWVRVANSNDINSLQNTINQQNQTIQSLITRLTNAENEINYIKANYIEGKQFPASQEAQAEAWENEKPTRLAMIEK